MGLLNDDHQYEFKVTAANLAGEGPASDPVSAVCNYTPPPAPRNVRGQSAGDGSVDLSWDAPGPNVYPLINGHTYQFKVTAVNLAGESPASNVVSARPMPPFPQAPSNLSATAGDGKASLHWTASPVSTCCSFTVSYLINSHTYQFRVRATNLSGDSAASNTDSAKPMPPFQQAPGNLTAVVTGGTSMRLDWSASPTHNVYYWVYYRDATTGGSYHRMAYPVSATALDVSYLFHGHTYSFYVTGTNLSGESSRSNIATVTLAPPDGTYDCASVTTAWRYTKINPLTAIQLDDISGRVCGYRFGNVINVVGGWSVKSGYKPQAGVFGYSLFDCTEGYVVWRSALEYPLGTSSTSGSGSWYPAINRGHYYAVRVWGAGGVSDGGSPRQAVGHGRGLLRWAVPSSMQAKQ